MNNNQLHIEIGDAQVQRNIGTFTSIYSATDTRALLDAYLHKNEVDDKAYRSIDAHKTLIKSFMNKIYDNTSGETIVTSGSTEAIILALYYAREKSSLKNPNIVISETAHHSVFKAAKLLSLAVRVVAPSATSYQLGQDISNSIDRNTILVVGTVGTTELGVIDNIDELNMVCNKKGVALHVDAAIGGFILPFVKPGYLSFKRLPALQSLNVSGHKYGLSLPGCGILLVNDKKLVSQNSEKIDYLSSGASTVETLLVTRSALGTVSLGNNIFNFNYEGYAENAKQYLATKKEFMQELDLLGVSYFSGSEYLPHIFIDDDRAVALSAYLSRKGWTQNAYKAKARNTVGVRVVIKKMQEQSLKCAFINDVKSYLTENYKLYGNISI